MGNYPRASGESTEAYIWRICQMRENGEIKDWDEVADVINNELFGNHKELYCGKDKYRKEYQSAKKFYDAGVFDKHLDDKHLDLLKKKTEEMEKEKRQLYDQRREYNKRITEDARTDHLHNEIIKVAKQMNKDCPLIFDGAVSSFNNMKEAVLVLSDWHYGMTADNIWNRYNTEICRDRVTKLGRMAANALSHHKISKLNVVMLGDAAHGAIHTTCRVKANEDTCDQLMHVSEILASLISYLSSYVREIDVYSCYGNHMRTVQNKKESTHSDNMEKIIPWWLTERLKGNDNIHVHVSPYKEFTKLKVFGYNICCVHGDLEQFKNIGLVTNTLFTKMFNETIDYTISGDKHHLEEFEQFGIESIMCRSLCGADDYANNNRLYSHSGQTLIIFDPEVGRECTYHFRLD